MKFQEFIFVTFFVGLVLYCNDTESVSTVGTTPRLIKESSESTSPTPNDKTTISKESDEDGVGSSTNSSINGIQEEILVVFFVKNNSSDSDFDDGNGNTNTTTPTTKKISKRETDRLTQSNDDQDGDDKDTSLEDNFNSTSKGNSSEHSSSNTEIILIPLFRPRPILIDIILFRVNDTKFNQTGKSNSSSSEELDDTTTKKASTHTHNRVRRDAIFSHLTNNSQSTTSNPDDGENENETFSSLDANNNNNDAKSSMSTFSTPNSKTMTTTQETNNPPSENNQPQFGVDGESGKDKQSDKNNSTIAEISPTTTATTGNPLFVFFMEVVEYGENVTKALFTKSKVENPPNANLKGRNHSESSVLDDDNDDDGGLSRTTGSTSTTTFTLLPFLASSSNQNSTNRNQHPQNGSDSPVQ